VSQIYDAKSYSDVKLAAKLSLALTHLAFLLCISVPLMLILTEITLSITAFTSSVAHGTPVTFAVAEAFALPFPALEWAFEVQSLLVLSWFVLLLLFTRMFGPTFYSAFFSPLRWCAYRLTAITGIFRLIATYVVRNRSWSVALAIAMGLEGYRHELPRIEQYPSSVSGNFVTYEDMPKGAEQRALARRGAWIDRHLNDAAQTFSKLVVTSAEIKLLLRAIEADPDLVHAAYYTDDDCIARVADWIAAKDGVHSNAAIARPQRVEMQVASLATPSFFQP